MKRYEPHMPRAAFAVSAVVMTLVTAALMVVAPMHQSTGDRDAILARVHAPATEVTIHPARVDVIALREHGDTWQQASARRTSAGHIE